MEIPMKKKTGRPRKEIPKESFEKLCALQCTKEEICGFFDITDKTLDAWCKRTYRKSFSDVFRQKRGAGKISLRRNQMQLAKKSATMAIWLGKQYLGQREPDIIQTDNERENDGFLDALKGEAGEAWDDD